ncbi:multiheme c-type cytochrome [Sulfurimonas sp.]
MRLFYINLDMFLMFITGILQMNFFHLGWSYFRVLEFLHIIGAILLTLFFIIPFLFVHVRESMLVAKQKSISGMLFGLTFITVLLSGVYLFLMGNRGGDEYGVVAYYVHLYGSFVLIFLLFVHLKKYFSVRVFSKLVGILAFLPLYSHSQDLNLTNIELESGVSRYHNIEWTNSVTCKECHPEIFAQWADSNHRHLADSNPYYMVMENLAGMDKGEDFREWCMGCHNPSAVTTHQEKTTHFMRDNIMPNPLFVEGSANLIENYKNHPNRLEQGVSCIACHRVTAVKAKGNSSYTLGLKNRKKYLYEDAHSDLKRWMSQKLINANPQVHKNEYMQEVYQKSEYCASCHNEFLPDSKKMVVSTYDEWKNSPYNNPNDPKKHKDCQDCHMSYIEDGKFVEVQGYSTIGGIHKKDIKTHYFSGANHFLAGLKSKEHEAQSIALLKKSAKLDMHIKNGSLYVGVKNVGAGHHLPTGASDFRELWLDVEVKDSEGKSIFKSGYLDEKGDIEPNAVVYNKIFGDKDGNPVGLLFWRYEKLLKDTRIPAKKRVVECFELPANISYPVDVKVRLNFRIYPQWVSNIVKAAYPSLPNPPVITLNELEQKFD